MTKIVVLPVDDAVDAVRAGARGAVRAALAQELEAMAEMRAMLETATHFKPWLTVEETARFIGCDASTAEGRAKAVRKLHEAGLPYCTVGRQRLTSRDELIAWLQEQPRAGVRHSSSPMELPPPQPEALREVVSGEAGVLVLDELPWPESLIAIVDALLPHRATHTGSKTCP